jgi:predicted Zn-dependent peptidase
LNVYTLPNGLRIVAESIPNFRSVSFGIWVKVGSRNEDPRTNGISHLIEHMIFKGTPRHSAAEIAEVFDGIGGNVNAFTSKEYTCYYAKVLDEHLPLAMDVLSDMFFNSSFDPVELEKEKKVIYEEIGMYEDTPDDLVHDLIARASYGDHPLGYSIIGTQDILRDLSPDDLRQHMNDHYDAKNTVLSISGNIDLAHLEQLVHQHFGDFHRTGAPTLLTPPEFRGNLIVHPKKTEQNHICMTLPGLPVGDDQLYAMVLMNNIFGGGMSSRMFQEIREKRGLAYSVYSYHGSYADAGQFTVYMGTAPKQTEEVLNVTVDLLDNLAAKGLTESELKKGKEQLKGNLILSLESTNARMNRFGKNELMLGKHSTLDEIISRIDAVSMEHIQAVIDRVFKSPIALAVVGQDDPSIHALRRDRYVPSHSN